MVLRRGDLRWSIGGRWNTWDQQLDPSGQRIALNGRFTSADAGVEFFGGLVPTQDGIRVALGDPAARISLGATRLRSELHHDIVPFGLEVGINQRLTFEVVVPVVLSYVSAVFDINRINPSPANVGLNPGFGNLVVGGLATSVRAQANTAVSSLQAAFPSCFGAAPAPGCAATIALAQNTAALGAGVAQVYGTAGRFAPTAGGALHTALLNRFTTLNAQLRAALGIGAGAADPIVARPTAAPVRMALQDFNTLLLTSGFGVLGDTLTALERTALGDVEVGARWQWLNAFDGAARDRNLVNPSGARWRSVVGFTARLPTAGRRYNGQFLDIGVSDGATALELRSTTDVIAGDHFWASISARYAHVLGDRVERRIPLSGSEALVPLWRLQSVERKLGDYAELAVTPRWMFNDNFAVSGDYLLFARRASRHSGGPITTIDPFTGTLVALDPSVLDVPHQLAQRVGVGITYSTVPQAGRGKSRLPLDVRWQRFWTVGGETTPFVMYDRLELRFLTGLFGHP